MSAVSGGPLFHAELERLRKEQGHRGYRPLIESFNQAGRMTEDRSKTLAKVMLNPGKPKSYDFFHIGSDVEVLFTYGYPIALRTGGDVYFPDLPYRKGEEKEGRLTQTTMRYINAFHPDLAHIRVSPREYDFIFASTMLSAFRPFIREA